MNFSRTTAIACLVASASAAATTPALRSRVSGLNNPGQGFCVSDRSVPKTTEKTLFPTECAWYYSTNTAPGASDAPKDTVGDLRVAAEIVDALRKSGK